MKILTILNDIDEHPLPDFLQTLELENQLDVVNLADQKISYDELVEKIAQCDKVISW